MALFEHTLEFHLYNEVTNEDDIIKEYSGDNVRDIFETAVRENPNCEAIYIFEEDLYFDTKYDVTEELAELWDITEQKQLNEFMDIPNV